MGVEEDELREVLVDERKVEIAEVAEDKMCVWSSRCNVTVLWVSFARAQSVSAVMGDARHGVAGSRSGVPWARPPASGPSPCGMQV
eukprot:5147676-Amphidinium_carterae.3